jgi:hypothetical protein
MSELIQDAEQAVGAVAKVGGVITSASSLATAVERYALLAVAALAALVISFGMGYLYRAHVDSVKQATQTAIVKTADTVASAVVATADTKTDATLQRKLTAANARAASLQQQIEAARNANPAPADCRLPDGLRDALSRDLAGHSGQVQNAVQ